MFKVEIQNINNDEIINIEMPFIPTKGDVMCFDEKENPLLADGENLLVVVWVMYNTWNKTIVISAVPDVVFESEYENNL